MSRRKGSLLLAAAACALAAPALQADHAPYHRPDGAVVYGDWGLHRPGHMPVIVEGPYVLGAPRFGTGTYYPSNRGDPGAYRPRPRERGPTVPVEPYFHRFWGAESRQEGQNVTDYPPFAPPDVIYAPRERRHRHGLGPFLNK